MSKKTYNFQVATVPARPRSKRRQLLGGVASAGGSTSSRPSGGSTSNAGNGVSHTHDNKVALDAMSIDSDNYLFLTQKPSGASDSQRRKVNAGHCDTATRATDADNADKWDNLAAPDYIDQPVRKTDSVGFENVDVDMKITAPEIVSPDFQSGIVRAGYKISTDPLTKRSRLEIGQIIADELLVDLLTHQKVQAIGGVLIVSQAWADIVRVEGVGSAYRCFYKPEDGAQLWRAGDQALCKDAGKYYWRYVSSVSDQPSVEGEHWLNLSVATADGLGVPADGDHIVLLGHRGGDTTRQGATIISSGTLGYADPFVHYGGINSFSLAGKQLTVIGDNSRFVGSSFTIVAPDGSLNRIPRDCGAWVSGRSEYYDRKSHNGSMWLCVAENGTDVEPSDVAEGVWLKQVERGDAGSKGDRFGQVYMWTGEAQSPSKPVGRTLAAVAAEGWVESNARRRVIVNKATGRPLARRMADGTVRVLTAGLPKHYRLYVVSGELTADGGELVGEWSEPLLYVEQSVIDGLNSDIDTADKKATDAKTTAEQAKLEAEQKALQAKIDALKTLTKDYELVADIEQFLKGDSPFEIRVGADGKMRSCIRDAYIERMVASTAMIDNALVRQLRTTGGEVDITDALQRFGLLEINPEDGSVRVKDEAGFDIMTVGKSTLPMLNNEDASITVRPSINRTITTTSTYNYPYSITISGDGGMIGISGQIQGFRTTGSATIRAYLTRGNARTYIGAVTVNSITGGSGAVFDLNQTRNVNAGTYSLSFDAEVTGGMYAKGELVDVMLASYSNPDYRFIFGVDGYGWGCNRRSFERVRVMMTSDTANPFVLHKEYVGNGHYVGDHSFEGNTKISGSLVAPGVSLIEGRVNAYGNKMSSWGPRGFEVVKYNNQTGQYKITHSLGHGDYRTTPTIMKSGAADLIDLIEVNLNYVVIGTRGLDSNYCDSQFEFTICAKI